MKTRTGLAYRSAGGRLLATVLAAGIFLPALVLANPVPQRISHWDFYAPPANGMHFQTGEEILLQVEFDRDIAVHPEPGVTPVDELPYLALRLQPVDPGNRARFVAAYDNLLVLGYTVRPGDFARPLTYANQFSLVLPPGSSIYTAGGDPVADAWNRFNDRIPDPASPDALAAADLRIQTVRMIQGTATVEAGQSTSQPWRVNRGGPRDIPMDVSLSLSDPSVASIDGSSELTIEAGSQQISFSLTGVSLGTTWVIAQPADYPDGVGAVSNLFTVVAPADQFLELEPAPGAASPPYTEGTTHNWRVRRAGSLAGALTVNLSFADNNPNPGTTLSLPPSVTIQSGQQYSPAFQIRARDGTYEATVTATDPGGTYNVGTAIIGVENIDPIITGGSISPATATVQQQVTASFTATDVPADIPKLSGTWNWGDGSAPVSGVAPGTSVSHAYATPGTYTVSLTVTDTDGGFAQATFTVEVTPGKTLTVNLIQPGDIQGLANIGSGRVTFTPPPAVTLLDDGATISVQYPDTQNSVLLTVIPDQPDGDGYNSYLFQLVGDGLTDNAQRQRSGTAASVTEQVRLDEDTEVDVLFSREWRQGDGRGDIDGDGLTDFWELQWGLNPLSAAGVHGRGGSLSGDRMPNAPNVFLPGNTDPDGEPYGGPFGYPIPLTVGWTGYAPDGPLFNNILQFRGQTIVIGDSDDPRTDPTVADTSGDGLTDGWLYYFRANAVNDPAFTGRAYDPFTLTGSLEVSNADIRNYFDPRFNRGLAGMDLDGDGLTTLEEYALGTNPIDWDTDGDGLPDGWEVLYGLDPEGEPGLDPLNPSDATGNPDNDYMAAAGGLIHNDVYLANDFDPRTGWAESILEPDLSWGDPSPNTREYTNIDEFLSMRWLMDRDDDLTSISPLEWVIYSTNPLTPDTDGDGIPDGWELYVGLNPRDTPDGRADGGADPDDDDLNNRGEFSNRGIALLDPERFPLQDPGWLNKFWPTDPFNPDTDGDQIEDGDEAGISRYDAGAGAGELVGRAFVGGGLNPTSVDTDHDFLPDYWEAYYSGGFDADGNRTGMDGTFGDAFDDYDGDGLQNYQEYLIGAVYHFNYDKWQPGLGFNGYDAGMFFLPVEEGGYGRRAIHWDWAEIEDGIKTEFMLAEARPARGGGLLWATTDPTDWDSDNDGMCDYYEMFHGLNPIWSLTVDLVGKGAPPVVRDARIQPWQVGDQEADPDQDGIPNWEEMLAPNRLQPQSHHTDPTPYWFTDMSYSESFVNLYYKPRSTPAYWWSSLNPPSYMYSFASNEGYDTDNDNIPDKRELIGTDGSGSTDPLNFMSPRRRRALYLDGDAAARTRQAFFHGHQALKSWTVELWIRPEDTTTGQRQIIIERPVEYDETDPLPVTELVRRNFRLGFESDGRLFVEYDNMGNDLLTQRARADAQFVHSSEWHHVAGVFDGAAGHLSLYVDGVLRGRTLTREIPATGVVEGQPMLYRPAPIVLGAADRVPSGIVHGGNRYYNFEILDPPPQPDLHNFYRGHVDEVRIWDGARTVSQLNDEMRRSFQRADVMTHAQHDIAAGASGADLVRLLYHYNFNTLPDPNYEGIVPAEFDALNGRPDDGSYPGIPWWYQAADRSTVYDNYHFVHWIQNTVSHLPLNMPLDTLTWSEIEIDEETGETVTNTFPNSMNPYNHGYTHAQSRQTEINPELGGPFQSYGFDRGVDRMYNNLLPLRAARADAGVELWDGGGPGHDTDAIDSNDDGIPDWWYIMHGFDPHGPPIAHEDTDGDGLTNYQEYLIGSDPHNAYSLDPDGRFTDFDYRPSPDSLTYGELFAVWDGIPAWWKLLYPGPAPTTGRPGLDPDRYDAHLDPDEDGWSNLAEFLGSYLRMVEVEDADDEADDGDEEVAWELVRGTDPLDPDQYPMPEIRVRLRYRGDLGDSIANVISEEQPVHVHFYRTPERDGHPVGHLVMTEGTVLTRALTEGYLVEGTNYVFAFMDLDGSGDWNTDWTDPRFNEPAGIGMIDVGWADGQEVTIELVDESPGYWRFGWASQVGARFYLVELRRGNDIIAERIVTGNARTYFHEGDYRLAGLHGLREGGHSAVIYAMEDYFGVRKMIPMSEGGVRYRIIEDVVATASRPVIASPSQGASFMLAREQIQWDMDPLATRYQIEIGQPAPGGGVAVLTSTTRMRPHRDSDTRRFRDDLPFFAGDTGNVGQVWTNGAYRLRLRGLSAGGNTQWSDWRSFNLNVKPPEQGGKSAIEGDLYYFGRVQRGWDGPENARYHAGETNLHIIVQAYANAAFAGEPAAQVQVNAVHGGIPSSGFMGRYELKGLQPGIYYLRAFIDLNGNRRINLFEPRGFRSDPALGGGYRGYEPAGVDVRSVSGTRARDKMIVIRDHDTDGDGIADGWEYSWFGTLAHGADDDPADTGMTLLEQYRASGVLLSPLTAFSLSSTVTDSHIVYLMQHDPKRDSDGDGMTDLHEILYAKTDPNDADDVLRLIMGEAVMPASEGQSAVMVIRWQGQLGVRYVLRSSSDMVNWDERGEFEGAGVHTFTETERNPPQFYKVEIR